jgi:hypothetical protein
VPVGSCLTLTLVLVASLAPQPAGAAAPVPLDRSPQSAALRSAAGVDLALGGILLFDGGPGAVLPLLLSLEPATQVQGADPSARLIPANPCGHPRRPRAP